MRRSLWRASAMSIVVAVALDRRISAVYIITMFGFDLRQGHPEICDKVGGRVLFAN
jgi:hypothetical protein